MEHRKAEDGPRKWGVGEAGAHRSFSVEPGASSERLNLEPESTVASGDCWWLLELVSWQLLKALPVSARLVLLLMLLLLLLVKLLLV